MKRPRPLPGVREAEASIASLTAAQGAAVRLGSALLLALRGYYGHQRRRVKLEREIIKLADECRQHRDLEEQFRVLIEEMAPAVARANAAADRELAEREGW